MRMHKIVFTVALATAAFTTLADEISSASSGKVAIDTTFANGTSLHSPVSISYAPVGWDDECRVTVDGDLVVGAMGSGSFAWQSRKTGTRKLVWSSGGVAMTSTVNVLSVPFPPTPTPNPPMAKDENIGITPTTRSFEVGGGGGAIVTSGSGTWTAAVSDPWITLNAVSGSAGYPVAYTVGASTNVGDRTGYIYVSGYTHTIKQSGRGAVVSPMAIDMEAAGGDCAVTLETSGIWAWDVDAGYCDWVSVTPTHGTGSANLTVAVAPYCEVSTRSTTVTVGGQEIVIFQNGRPMKLSTNEEWCDYLTHVIPLTVNALAVTTWSVTPNASWISVVDAGNGRGGDGVSVAVAENPSYAPRTGTVTIGTETLTIHQDGRKVLQFAISPAETSASVTGANGLIAVTATPDLPWTAMSGANWLTVNQQFTRGSGCGNIVYVVSPNPTLFPRSGIITITPEAASGMAAKTHMVSQPAAQSAISNSGYEFVAGGESTAVDITVDDIVEWTISESLDWIEISGSTSRVGPGSVTIKAVANDTVYPRSGTVMIAGKTFGVSQKARGVEVQYENRLFGTDGGLDSFSVHPDGNVLWTAVSSDPTWITVFGTTSGTGAAEVEYVVSPYTGTGVPRIGTITIGDKKIYITQRAYDLSINPIGEWVTGNSGAGEIGISAGLGDVWNAIVTEPWITIVTGYDAGTGSGTVRYTYTENNTGKTRTGKIIVAGEVYTLTQAARMMVQVSAAVEGGGSVSGEGTYTLGENVTLTAIPDSGFEFLYWSGSAGDTMQNPLTFAADVPKNFTAHFGPLTPEFISAESTTDGVRLSWNALAWATEYRIYRAPASEMPSTALVTFPAASGSSYLDESGAVEKTYWYWIEAVGGSVSAECRQPVTGAKMKPVVISPITYANLKGATHGNPSSYTEGSAVTFAAPTGNLPAGYTFAGWSPASIPATKTGAVAVSATWTANSYRIVYDANGGVGNVLTTECRYDEDASIAANGFTRVGYEFLGWAASATGETVYEPGQVVRNLTAAQGGVVSLYAVWEKTSIAAPVITPPDGSVFFTDSCTVEISCATPGATIYYATNGTPRTTSKYVYAAPFTLNGTATIKAIAVLGDAKSEYATATITKRTLSLATSVDAPDLAFTTGGDADWSPVFESDEAKVGDTVARSGLMPCAEEWGSNESWLQVSVDGPGTLGFWWKVDCEWDESGDCEWDRLMYFVDGAKEDSDRIDGATDWEWKTVVFTDAGPHTVRWVYYKDDYDEDFASCEDCGWIDGVTWTPGEENPPQSYETHDTPVPVPYEWLDKYGLGGSAATYETAANATAANGVNAVWECFVAGLDPTDAGAFFQVLISFKNGVPTVSWEPKLPPGEEAKRVYTIKGKAELADAWSAPADMKAHRFFKVDVKMK